MAPFVYGETKTYEIESAGVAETILTKPDGWRVALKDDVLSVTAPAADAAGFEAEGTVAVIYFDGAERSSVAKLGSRGRQEPDRREPRATTSRSTSPR